MSQGNLTGFVNKCCLLPGELLTLPTGSLSVLSITISPCSFFPFSHSSFTLTYFTHILSHINLTPLSFFFSFPHKYSNVQILVLSNAMNGRDSCFCLSPTHLNTFCSSLSLLSASLPVVWWGCSAVWAERLSRIWPQHCCCSADLCVWLS